MKFLQIALAAIVVFAASTVTAQTVDEIVAKNIEAMGGKEKLNTLKTVKMTGSMSVQGADVIITRTKSHNIGMRMDIEVMGTSNYQLANTTKGWNFMPIFGMAAPEEMTPAQLKAAVAFLDIQDPLLDYKVKGNTVALKGSEKVDGADAWHLLLTFKNGKTADYYIDAKTNRVVKISTLEDVNGQEQTADIFLSDYKQTAGGYWFPYSETTSRGTIVFDNIETNIAVDENLFKN